MTKLSVNVNKIALLRNQRDLNIPDVLACSQTIINAGAHGITVHPRPDERHIRYADAYALAEMLTVEYNIEGNPFTGKYMQVIRDIKPDQATLVPDEPAAETSDHGWNLTSPPSGLAEIIDEIKSLGTRVSLFMDPDPHQIELAAQLNADRVELYTEPYAKAFATGTDLEKSIQTYAAAAEKAQSLGMGVNAGHDLNLKNLKTFCQAVPNVKEVSIGHALIADALEMGLAQTVKHYLALL